MNPVDLEKLVIKQFIANSKKLGFEYYDISLSSMRVASPKVTLSSQKVTTLAPALSEELSVENCTTSEQEMTKSWTKTASWEQSYSLSSSLIYSEEISASVDLGIEIGGSRTLSVNLTGEKSSKKSGTSSETLTLPIVVPACSKVRVPIMVTESLVDATFELEVDIFALGSAKVGVDWAFDPTVSIVIRETVAVDVTVKGMKSVSTQAQYILEKGACSNPECNEKMVKVRLKEVKVESKGIGNDWMITLWVQDKVRKGGINQIKGLVYEHRLKAEQSELPLQVQIGIIEQDPVYPDPGSGAGVITIDPSKGSGTVVIPARANAEKRDTGSASFEFVFEWTVH